MEPEVKQGEDVALAVLALSEKVGSLLCKARDLPPGEALKTAHDVFAPDELLAATLATLKNRLSLDDGAVYLLALFCKRIAEDIKQQSFLSSLMKRRANIRKHGNARQVWLVISPIWQSMQIAGKAHFNQFRQDFYDLLPDQSS
jgi:hypothetical protein